jgi:anaerobic carbon-monoxide dehydrogenase, CODH/ACS complex subunit epsilon
MSSSVLPYFHVNTMSGTKYARLVEDPGEYAHYILAAQRPLLVLGPLLLKEHLGGKLVLEHAIEIGKTINIPICATAHTSKKLREMGIEPDSTLDIIEIINHLKDPAWKGVKGEGNHDLVMFFGIRSDLGTQGLSTLKHFATHLKTITLDRYYFPNASYSMQNFRRDDKYHEFLDALINTLKTKEA